MRTGFSIVAAIVLALLGAVPAAFPQASLPGGVTADDGTPGVSASFEPAVGEVGKPVIFRVRITAMQLALAR